MVSERYIGQYVLRLHTPSVTVMRGKMSIPSGPYLYDSLSGLRCVGYSLLRSETLIPWTRTADVRIGRVKY